MKFQPRLLLKLFLDFSESGRNILVKEILIENERYHSSIQFICDAKFCFHLDRKKKILEFLKDETPDDTMDPDYIEDDQPGFFKLTFHHVFRGLPSYTSQPRCTSLTHHGVVRCATRKVLRIWTPLKQKNKSVLFAVPSLYHKGCFP